VLMTVMNDPVGAGLVSSLAHPSNHTSGTASLNQELTPKMLEFVREIVPGASVLAALFNSANPTSPAMMENLRANGDRAGITVLPFALEPRTDLEALFSKLASMRPDALQVIKRSLDQRCEVPPRRACGNASAPAVLDELAVCRGWQSSQLRRIGEQGSSPNGV